jgi:aquaporin Z
MLAYLVEFLGTFVFLSVILATGQPILIALALLLAILVGGSVSGGHFNPAVSAMFYANGGLSLGDLGGYVAAQVLGGLAAVGVYVALTRRKTPNVVGV